MDPYGWWKEDTSVMKGNGMVLGMLLPILCLYEKLEDHLPSLNEIQRRPAVLQWKAPASVNLCRKSDSGTNCFLWTAE